MLVSNGKYYYKDDFMFFEFQGINSAKYNLFRVNDGSNLAFYASNNGSVSYSTPDYQTQTYLLGAKSNQRVFSWNCAAEGLSLRQVQDLAKWLTPGQYGALRFDGIIDWCYDVALDTLTDFNKWLQADGTYIVTLTVTFKTIGANYIRGYWQAPGTMPINADVHGLSAMEALNNAATNEYGIPEVFMEYPKNNKHSNIYIFDVGNMFSTFGWKSTYIVNPKDSDVAAQLMHQTIKLAQINPFITQYNETDLWEYDFAKIVNRTIEYDLSYDSQTGLFLSGRKFVEDNDSFTNINTNSTSTICTLDSHAPAQLFLLDENSIFSQVPSVRVKKTQELLDLISTGKPLYLSAANITKKILYNEGAYSNSEGTSPIYPIAYTTSIALVNASVKENYIEFTLQEGEDILGNKNIHPLNPELIIGNLAQLLYVGTAHIFHYYDTFFQNHKPGSNNQPFSSTAWVNKYNTL